MSWPDVICRRVCFVLFACLIGATRGAIMGDECDWTGSGLSTPSIGRGVTPVYLRCSSGKIRWIYPRGALRVLLRLPGQDRNFRACIKMRHEGKRENAARVFLEGPRSLIPLYDNDRNFEAVRCFTSKNGQAAVYIEATDNRNFKKEVTEIEYDLQAIGKNMNGYDIIEECRPCSQEELAHAFCTSDLVTRGTIHEIENNEQLSITKVNVKITKLIRHTTGEEFLKRIDTNSVGDAPNHTSKLVALHMPRHCDVTHGVGEFVFMARRKLGDLVVQCAPRLEEWAALMNAMNEMNRAHCVLRS